MRRSSLILSVFLLLIVNADADGKGYASKIVIEGVGLTRPIEITDQETLRKFSPWYGEFIDWRKGPMAAPAEQSQSYDVLFYLTWHAGRMIRIRRNRD